MKSNLLISRTEPNKRVLQSCVVNLLYRIPNISEFCCCKFINQELLMFSFELHLKTGIARSRCSYSLPAGRSGDRIPMGARFSAHVQTGHWAHPTYCAVGTGSFPGVKAAGAWR
jgi:hypothetical protein